MFDERFRDERFTHCYRSGAPVLSVVLEIDDTAEVPLKESDHASFVITVRVTYEESGIPDDSRPITFHYYMFHNYHILTRLRDGKWEYCESDRGCMAGIAGDFPDIKVKVGDEQAVDFVSLRLGESWTRELGINDELSPLPEGTVAGDTLRCRYNGATLDWWDWGDKEVHRRAGTEIELPSFRWARVLKPWDNDGRPEIVVPASNAVEFSVKAE